MDLNCEKFGFCVEIVWELGKYVASDFSRGPTPEKAKESTDPKWVNWILEEAIIVWRLCYVTDQMEERVSRSSRISV